MRVKKMRRLGLMERINLSLLADRIEKEVDATAAGLVRRVAAGDDTALVPLVDRLKEVGREDDAERLKKLVLR